MMDEVKEVNVYANHTNVVIKLIDNEFRKTIPTSGIILPSGGTYNSNETGQVENDLDQIIMLARVINVGPQCDWVPIGDKVYVDVRSIRPVPFKGLGYGVTNEQNILLKVE